MSPSAVFSTTPTKRPTSSAPWSRQPFAKERYGSDDAAVGQTFEILGIPFTIIGVFKESMDDFGQSEIADETVLIPYSVARYFTGTERVNQIYFSMQSMNEVPDAAKEIVRVIKSRHRPNSDYKPQTLTELLTTAAEVSDALTWRAGAVSCVTLAVGGVGIMNIMLANVRSRIREIGIRKALGATYREIKLQFLTEAVLISLSGGLGGQPRRTDAFPFRFACSPTMNFHFLVVRVDCNDGGDACGHGVWHGSRHPRRATEPRGGAEV